jgi:hypothetical protein
MSVPSSSRVLTAALGLSLVMLAGGCPLFAVDVEVPDVCMTQKDVEVPGVPIDVAGGIDEVFTFDDLSAFDVLEGLDADAYFHGATVRATHGVDTLTFVESASLEVASNNPESTLPTRRIYACDDDCPAEGDALVIPALDDIGALDYIRSGSLSIALQASGSMPTTAWKLDVEVCVGARASYEYAP